MTVNEIALQWWQWTGSMLWQVSLLIGLISLIDLIIRRWAWPQVRYGLWLLVLLKLMMPPTWSSPVSLISQARPQLHETVKKTLGLQKAHRKRENGISGFSSAMPEARMVSDLSSRPAAAVTEAKARVAKHRTDNLAGRYSDLLLLAAVKDVPAAALA
jgi:hypothetical protein